MLKKIFEMAREIRELEPWQWMDETDVFGIRIPGTDRIYFVSVMGSGGEFTGVSFYRGASALAGFYMIQEEGNLAPPETIITIPHILLSYAEKEELSEEHVNAIKDSGLSFEEKGSWPKIDEIIPALFPVFPGNDSLTDILILLEQSLRVFKRAKTGVDFLYKELKDFDSMLIRELSEKKAKSKIVKSWSDIYIPLPELGISMQINAEAPQELIDRVSDLPESQSVLQLELKMLPDPIKEKDDPVYFPFLLVLLHKRSEKVLITEILKPLPDLETMYEYVPSIILNQIIKLGYRPKRFEVRLGILYSLMEITFMEAGCRMIKVMTMPQMDEFIDGLKDQLKKGRR
jgi:hypothetical protein